MIRIALRAGVLAVMLAAAVSGALLLGGSGPGPDRAVRLAGGGAGATGGSSARALQPIVIRPDTFSISPPMRTVNVPIRASRHGAFRTQEPERPSFLRPQSGLPDPVRQTSAPIGLMPSPAATFEGLDNDDNDTLSGFKVVPPDVNGDVGPNDYVEYINVVWSVYDKLTGAPRTGFPKSNAAIWDGMGDSTCEDWWEGDSVVMYDQAADRWFLSEFAFVIAGAALVPPFKLCVAVSTTNDPTGSYARYSYTFCRTNCTVPIFPDYPKFGVWPDGYYVSVNQFNATATAYEGAGAGAFDRAAMLAGSPTAAFVYFDTADQDLGGMLPSDWEGDIAPPAGSPNIFIQGDDSAVCCATNDRLQIWKLDPDFTTPANSTFTHTDDIEAADGLAAIDMDICNAGTFQFACIPHGNPTQTHKLDTLSDRLMHRLQYRKYPSGVQSLVVSQTVDATGTGQAGVRWYELRLDGSFNPALYQHGTFAPADSKYRWMPSAAMDGHGNLAVGYSYAGTNTEPEIRYAGRLNGDPLNALSQGEATLFTGGGTQTDGPTFGAGAEVRWGDYTAMQVDPVDECTFWYINEYYPADSDYLWHTRFGSFKYPSCGTATAVSVKSFTSRWTKAGVALTWRTAGESGTAGFNVWRTGRNGVAKRVNAKLIRAKQAGARGATYRFVDRAVKPGAFATYRLQTVGLDGKRTWYGIGSAPTRS